MLVVAIDIGSYSIKTISVKVERKSVNYVSHQEIKIEHYEKYDPNASLRENQFSIVKDIIEVVPLSAKVIMTVDDDLVTTRFISLPVKSRKKAELMIPFQIDDEIPYSVSEAHLANSIRLEKDQAHAIVNIFKRDQFEEYLEEIRVKTSLPDVLTTPTVAMANMASSEFSDNNFCILDMGHSKIKAYFFHQGVLSSFYTCFMGGKDIDMEIAQRYNIKLEDAQVYKHQNCFVLTESQKEMADGKQKEFSTLMESIFSRFISDLRRWELGHRLATGYKVSHVYLTGGTSNIRGLDQYIEEQIKISTERFPEFNTVSFKSSLEDQFNSRFAVATILAGSYRYKSLMANALNDDYSQTGSDELPLNTMAFVGVRSFICALIIILSLLLENYFISSDRKKIVSGLQKTLKSPVLNLKPRERRQAITNPDQLLSKIKKKQKSLVKEVKTIKSSISINALHPLSYLIQNLGTVAPMMTFYSSLDGSFMNATFKSEKIEELQALEKKLVSALSGKKPRVVLDKEKLELKVEAMVK